MVADEKLRPTTSMSGRALRAENRVMVFPEPGGPHNTLIHHSFISSICNCYLFKWIKLSIHVKTPVFFFNNKIHECSFVSNQF